MSTSSNFLLTIIVARNSSQSQFGAFSLAFSIYLFALGLSRAFASDPLLVRTHEIVSAGQWDSAVQRSSGCAVVHGILAGLVLVIIGTIVGGETESTFLILAIFMPALLLQDSWRCVHFSRRHAERALTNDGVWTVLMIAGIAIFASQYKVDVVSALGIWGASALCAAIYGYIQTKEVPSPLHCLSWYRYNRQYAFWYAGEFLCVSTATTTGIYIIAGLAGLSAAGSIKGAITLAGPFTTLLVGAFQFVQPWFVAKLAAGSRSLTYPSLLVSIAVMIAGLLWSLILFLIPDSFGVKVLGASWTSAHALLNSDLCVDNRDERFGGAGFRINGTAISHGEFSSATHLFNCFPHIHRRGINTRWSARRDVGDRRWLHRQRRCSLVRTNSFRKIKGGTGKLAPSSLDDLFLAANALEQLAVFFAYYRPTIAVTHNLSLS